MFKFFAALTTIPYEQSPVGRSHGSAISFGMSTLLKECKQTIKIHA